MRLAQSASRTARRQCGLTSVVRNRVQLQLDGHAQQHGRDAAGVGIGELRDVAGAHQDRHLGLELAQASDSAVAKR